MVGKLISVVVASALCSGCITNDSSGTFSRVRSRQTAPGKYIVACVDGQRYCLDEADKLCAAGYDIKINTTNNADYGRITMIIECERY